MVCNVKSTHILITKDMVNEASRMNQSISNNFVPFVNQNRLSIEDNLIKRGCHYEKMSIIFFQWLVYLVKWVDKWMSVNMVWEDKGIAHFNLFSGMLNRGKVVSEWLVKWFKNRHCKEDHLQARHLLDFECDVVQSKRFNFRFWVWCRTK